jgi:hypothetical protein
MISIPSVKEEQYQFVVQFLLDICCIPHVDRATINETYFEEVPVKAPVPKDGTKENETQQETQKTEKVKKERSNVCMLKIAECNYGNPKSILDVKK